jgi:hypothetical protein
MVRNLQLPNEYIYFNSLLSYAIELSIKSQKKVLE